MWVLEGGLKAWQKLNLPTSTKLGDPRRQLPASASKWQAENVKVRIACRRGRITSNSSDGLSPGHDPSRCWFHYGQDPAGDKVLARLQPGCLTSCSRLSESYHDNCK